MKQSAIKSQHQTVLASLMGTLGTHSTFSRIHLAADSGHWNWNERVSVSHSSSNNRDNFPKTAWDVCKYYMSVHDIIICNETASECLQYASSSPNIVQISAFLNSRDWLLKWFSLESADFQMSPSDMTDIGLKRNIFFVYCYVLAGIHQWPRLGESHRHFTSLHALHALHAITHHYHHDYMHYSLRPLHT
jgi:hypothetical protein